MRSRKEMNDFDENLFIVRGTVEYIQLNKIRNIHNQYLNVEESL